MASCVQRLEKDLGFDCENKPTAGIEQNILLINREDIDWAGTTRTGNLLTSLVLKQGKTAFSVKGIAKHITFSSKPVIDNNGINGFTHSVAFRVYGNSAEDYKQIDDLIQGASLVAIVQRNQKGENNKNVFEVLGLNVGLEASSESGGLSIYENDGVYMLAIATPEGTKEPNSILKWLETDYKTTKTKFDKKLAS